MERVIIFSFPIILGLFFLSIILNACQETNPNDVSKVRPIKDAEIIAFQKAYGISFNAISKAIEDGGYYESAARKHIEQHYNFDEGKVMLKFVNDEGIANQNWRKMDWNNNGIIKEGNIAIVMGTVQMINDDNDSIFQNYTMGLRRNSSGDLKLIVHKISRPCE